MKKLVVSCLLLLSCSGVEDEESGWKPLHGTPYTTPKYKLTFYWVGPGGKYLTPEETGVAIDEILYDWFQIYEARWGYGLSRELRTDHLRGISIQLYSGGSVPGLDKKNQYETGIYWPWQHQIDVAMATSYHWDRGLNMWSEGLQVLRHEWSHVFQGAYHPY